MGDFDPAVESFARISNRRGLEMFVKLIMSPDAKRNAYLAHGYSDVHDTAHMRALTGAFVKAGYNVIIWDATHSWGRSEGHAQEASFYHHHEDLEDVIDWSRSQPWYIDHFALAGHSLGGMVAGTYAAAHAGQVDRLVLVSPVVSGPALRRRVPVPLRLWWRIRGELRLPGRGDHRPYWEFLRSSWSFDLLASSNRLTMPVLIVGAGRDLLIPPRLLRRLHRSLIRSESSLQIVSWARHGFDTPREMAELDKRVGGWLGIQG